MDSNLLFGVSLTASFLGGMVALFSPCCITFLFPSYLGTIFHDRRRVVLLTLIFAAGLASILVPVALGMRIIVSLFDQYHTTTYLLGSLIMILMGIMTLFEVKLSLPLPRYTMPKETTFISTYILGVFSGITSSCCAPVLFAAITLSSLSPTFITALIVSSVYVLGIVFPLFFLSLLYDKLTNQYLFKVKKNLEKPLKILASATFIISGIVISYLALTNRIQMSANMAYGEELRLFIYQVSSRLKNPLLDILILIGIIILFIIMFKEARHDKEK
jgi:cytochrome c biogenesis protein CcdA